MRARALLAIVVLALPVAAEAQRLPMPRIRDRGPATPAPLPPAARPVAHDRQYARFNYTVESYPMISWFDAPALGGQYDGFTTGGVGERLDFRLHERLSLTLDLTQSFLGGPAVAQTAELGVRVRPEHSGDRKWYPFLDARGGFLYLAERRVRAYDYVDPMSGSYYDAAHGFGGVAGAGVEYAVHPMLTLTTGASILRANVRPLGSGERNLQRGSVTAMRYSIGVRFNPGRWIAPGSLPQRITQ